MYKQNKSGNCRREDIYTFVTRVADCTDPLSIDFVSKNLTHYRHIFNEGCNDCHEHAVDAVRELAKDSERQFRFYRNLSLLRGNVDK